MSNDAESAHDARKHVVGHQSYFTVTGARREFAVDEKSGNLKPTGKVLPEHVRFEVLRLSDAEAFATDVYRHEHIVCEIHEVPR